MNAEKWEELEKKLNECGFSLGKKALKNLQYLRILQDIGKKQGAGKISEETAEKAALTVWEMSEDERDQ